MSYDLDQIKCEAKDEGADMPVLHPVTLEPIKDDTGNPAIIRLAGMDSAIYRKAANSIANRRTKGNRPTKMTAERFEADSLELICKCTLAWSNLVIGGKAPKTPEEIYEGRKWLKEQADQWIHDRANYLGN